MSPVTSLSITVSSPADKPMCLRIDGEGYDESHDQRIRYSQLYDRYQVEDGQLEPLAHYLRRLADELERVKL